VSVHTWRHRAEQPAGPDGEPATGPDQPRLGLTLAAASIGIFAVQLDFFALNLALPDMASELDTSTTDLQWVISGYMLALAAFLIPGGRLGDIFGRKRMLIAGLALFGLASLGGGLAPNAGVVIGFRILQGVGAAILFPLAIAIVTAAFPPERTMRAIGNAYGIGAVAMAFGPVLGGGLTELIDWRVVLLVNVPLVAVAIAIVSAGVTESQDTTVPHSVDLPGLTAIVLGIAAITLAVDRVNEADAALSVGLALAGLLFLTAFILRERSARWPLVRLDLFRNTPYVIVTVMATVANVAFVVGTFCTTIYLQQVEDYSPLTAGLIFLAASIAAGTAGPISGKLGERFDIPRTIATATVLGSVGLFVVSLGGALGPYLAGLALFGLGYGIGWAMASVGTQTVVPPERAGQASGVTLATVIGTAGLAVAAAGGLIETGAGDSGLGSAIEGLLLAVAVGSAALAALLAVVAARLLPRPARG
jgi:EmrB/QacA subfamily drug resistance transporter